MMQTAPRGLMGRAVPPRQWVLKASATMTLAFFAKRANSRPASFFAQPRPE